VRWPARRSRARLPWGAEDSPIPADKHLDPAWVRGALSERGTPTTYSSARKELGWIGMPIGGIACGQPLPRRRWQSPGSGTFFTSRRPRPRANCDGPHYKQPAEPSSPLEQGFQVLASTGSEDVRAPARRAGLPRRALPRANIRSRTSTTPIPELPFRVELEAWSPFVPLWTDDSSLPATVFEITVVNAGQDALHVELLGRLENLCAPDSLPTVKGTRRNAARRWKATRESRCRLREPPPRHPTPGRWLWRC
jgi:hypothetical protein